MPGNKNNTGNCCCDIPDENCCQPYIYYCVCGEYVVLLGGGSEKIILPEDCCDCEVAPTLTVWLTCEPVDPPVMPPAYQYTLNWEYDCDGDIQSGTVDISDACDGSTILEDVISVTGCTLNDFLSANLEDMDLCYECADGCCEFSYSEDSELNEEPGTATFTLDNLLVCVGDTIRIDFTVTSSGGPQLGICAERIDDTGWEILDYSESLTWAIVSPFPPPGTFSTTCLADPDYDDPGVTSVTGWVTLKWLGGVSCPTITLFGAEFRYQHHIFFEACP